MSWEVPTPFFRGLNINSLGTDEAFLNVTYRGSKRVWLYLLNDDCHLCPYQRVEEGEGEIVDSSVLTVHTHHPTHMRLRSEGDEKFVRFDEEDGSALCDVTATFAEFGVYDLKVEENLSATECRLTTSLEPVNAFLAILVCVLVYLGTGMVWWGINRLAGDHLNKMGTWLGWSKGEVTKSGKKRLRSLDTFRGISIALMIFVNDGGGGYYFLEHSTWNGLYVADLVFPWFLWIMGVCIPMSIRSHAKRATPKLTILWQVGVRSVKLFLLGFVLNTLWDWIDLEKLRVPGVLQRFAICYFVVAMLGMMFAVAEDKPSTSPILAKIQDITSLLPHWLIMSVVVLTYLLVVYLVPAPGCQAGYAGPGGLHDWSKDLNHTGCIGGITGYIDKIFFTVPHIYGNPTAKSVYQSGAFDPEGILGSLMSIFQVFLGYQAGQTLQIYSGHKDRLARFLSWGAATGILGTILCGASQNDGWIPLNKNLWSLSFVLITTSLAFFLLAALYFVIDMQLWWKGQPFVYAGMNSILLYCGHSVGHSLFPWHFRAGPMKTHAAKLPEALWGATLWVIISFILYRKKVFITV